MSTLGGSWAPARRWLERLDPDRFAVAAGAGIVVLTVMGALWVGGVEVRGFDINGEQNVPAAFTAGLLGLSSVLALAHAVGEARPGAWVGFSALLALVAADEFLEIHEAVADAGGSGVYALYVPVAALAAVVAIPVWRQLRQVGPAVLLLLGSAGAWLVAQMIDAAQAKGGDPLWTTVPEEFLEMAGSTLLVLALLVALRATPSQAEVE